MSRLPRISVVLMAVVAVATGPLACRDATTPRDRSNAGISQPSFTLGVFHDVGCRMDRELPETRSL